MLRSILRARALALPAGAVLLVLAACGLSDPDAPPTGAVSRDSVSTTSAPVDPTTTLADAPAVDLRVATGADLLAHVRAAPGEVKVVNMWATWCGPCREEFPDLLAVADSLKGEGMTLTFVSVDDSVDADAARRFLSRHGVGAAGGPATFIRSPAQSPEAFAAEFTPEWKGDLPVTLVYDRTGTRRAFARGTHLARLPRPRRRQRPRHELRRRALSSPPYPPMTRLASTLRAAAFALAATFVPAAQAQTAAADTVGTFGIGIGAPLPMADVVLAPATGAGQPLASYSRGSGLVVVLWSNRCPWVERYDARVTALAARVADRFGVVLVSTASQADNAARATEKGYAVPYLSDAGGAFVRALGAVRTPQVYVFGVDGRLAYVGAIDDSPADAERVSKNYVGDVLASISTGQAPGMTRTEALGCLIR